MNSKNNKRNVRSMVDKFDEGKENIKKITIVSALVLVVMLVVGIFVGDDKKSYAADFLDEVPEEFTSSMSAGQHNQYQELFTYSKDGKTNKISLPLNFKGSYGDQQYEYIYCMDRRLAMGTNIKYLKSKSVKDDNFVAEDVRALSGKTAKYPGLIYILQHHSTLGGSDEENYYYTQIAVWWYLDRANGYSDDKNYSITTGLEDNTVETTYEDKYIDEDESNAKFINNLSVLDKIMLNDIEKGREIKKIVEDAINSQNKYLEVQDNRDVNIDVDNITYTIKDDYVITSIIKPTSANSTFVNYSIILNDKVGNVEILDENDNIITSPLVSAGKGFKLRVPVSSLNGQKFKANVTVTGFFENLYDAYVYKHDGTQGNYQRALLGKVVNVTTPATFNLEAPSIEVPDTSSNSILLYGVGSLIVVAGILLIVMAKKPKNAKRK